MVCGKNGIANESYREKPFENIEDNNKTNVTEIDNSESRLFRSRHIHYSESELKFALICKLLEYIDWPENTYMNDVSPIIRIKKFSRITACSYYGNNNISNLLN